MCLINPINRSNLFKQVNLEFYIIHTLERLGSNSLIKSILRWTNSSPRPFAYVMNILTAINKEKRSKKEGPKLLFPDLEIGKTALIEIKSTEKGKFLLTKTKDEPKKTINSRSEIYGAC